MSGEDIARFRETILPLCDTSLLPRTRQHPWLSAPGMRMDLLREDEAGGFGMAGKRRKYASLLPYLQAHGIREAALIGGAQSNNLPALAALLIERGIRPVPFVRAYQGTAVGVNRMWLNHFVPESEWVVIPHDEWNSVESRAAEWAGDDPHRIVIPEGAAMAAALPGALSLPLQIAETCDPIPDHIWMDAGTGFSAAALTLGAACLFPASTMHVVLIAGTQDSFAELQKQVAHWAADLPGLPASLPGIVEFHSPDTARSFGSVNSTMREEVHLLASEYGIAADPVYSAKLLRAARLSFEQQEFPGHHLVVHSGGAHINPGFFLD